MPLTEPQRLRIICQWVESRVIDRQDRLSPLLSHIQWQRVGARELYSFLSGTALLSDNEYCYYHVLQSLKDSCLLPDLYFRKLSELRTKFISSMNDLTDSLPEDLSITSGDVDDHDTNDDDYMTVADNNCEASTSALVADSDLVDLVTEPVKDNFICVTLRENVAETPESAETNDAEVKSSEVVRKRKRTVCNASKVASIVDEILPEVAKKRRKMVRGEDNAVAVDSVADENLPVIVNKKKKKVHVDDPVPASEHLLKPEVRQGRNRSGKLKETKSDSTPEIANNIALVKRTRKTALKSKQDSASDENTSCKALDCSIKARKALRSKSPGQDDVEQSDNEVIEVGVNAKKKRLPKPENMKCLQCSYRCRSRPMMARHLNTAHNEGETFPCCMCDFTCKWNRELYAHLRVEHFTGPPYTCDKCVYTTDKVPKLMVHRMDHNQEKPFECTTCNMKFKLKSNMVAHMNCHTGL